MTHEPSAMSYDHGEKTEEELGRERLDSTSPTPKRARSTRKPSSKKTKRASKPAARKTSAASAKKPPPKKRANGTDRTSKDGTKFWVMSVHIPLPLLAKLDRKVAALVKGGKRSSRSQFAIQAISSKL